MKTYNKLVRDKIPEIIVNDGKKCHTAILNDDEYRKLLFAKLVEEANEANEAMSLEELADVKEVLLAATKSLGYSEKELEEVRKKKESTNGAFEKKILLIDVE